MSGRTAAPLEGSERARRYAAGIVAVLSGESVTAEACEMMGVSLPRYYQLETQALVGMVAALEPKAKGRQRTVETELKELRKENTRLVREVSRLQSLARMSRRALGITEPKAKKTKTTKATRRPKRGKRAIARLVKPEEDGKSAGGAG